MRRLLELLALSSLLLAACAGPRSGAENPTAVTVGSLSQGSRMAQVLSSGRTWSVELEDRDLVLRVDGGRATFHDARRGQRVDYRYDQASSSWIFLLDGGQVHWRGDEIVVGGTSYDLSESAPLEFQAADWREGNRNGEGS